MTELPIHDPDAMVGDVYSFGIQVRCGQCGAEPGQDCIRKRRNSTEQFNVARAACGMELLPVDRSDTMHARRFDAGRNRQTRAYLDAVRPYVGMQRRKTA